MTGEQQDDNTTDPSAVEGTQIAPEQDPLEKLRLRMVEGVDAPVADASPTDTEEQEDPEEVDDPTETEETGDTVETPEEGDDTAETPEEDPYEGFSEDERGKLGRRATKRIKQLHAASREYFQKLTETESKLSEIEEDANVGRYYSDYVTKQGLEGEDIDTALTLAAAVQNTPEKALPVLEQLTEALYKRLGQTPPTRGPSVVAPFVGDLTPDMVDLIEVYGFDEARVRKWAAVERLAASTAPVQPAAPAQPTSQPRLSELAGPGAGQVPPVPKQAVQAQVEQPVPDEAEQVANLEIANFLLSQKVAEDDLQAYLGNKLWPIMAKFSPKGDPRLLSPENRIRAVKLAHDQLKLVEPRRSPTRAPTPVSAGGSPRASSGPPTETPTEDPLEAIRKRLVG